MSVLKLLIYPEPALRLVSEPVRDFDASLLALQTDLFESMAHYGGCGLAAPQVNIQKRAFAIDLSEDLTEPQLIVNPEILEATGSMQWDEACLSFPGVRAMTTLASAVTLKYCDVSGKEHIEKFSEDINPLACACVQHELGHLDGVLYIDSLSSLKRDRLLKKMAKYIKMTNKA